MSHRILIVEDDMTIAAQMKIALENWGYEVFIPEDLSDPLCGFARYNPHLVLMDITLPFNNGFFRCSKIREISNVPVIFVSSANDNLNMITAINMGGDDFITKPFDFNVLLAKIKAILRRSYDFTGSGNSFMEHRGAIYNSADSSLTYNGEKIELTKNESRIMHALISKKGNIVTRNRLMEQLWNDDLFVDENTLSVNVNRLRKKLDEIDLPDFIKTRKGQGYIIE